MNYEIVNLSEKKLAGFNARTSNADPTMNETIAGLWKQLFETGTFFSMKNKVNAYSIGLYSDDENGAEGEYDITVGCEVTTYDNMPEGMIQKIIPAGNYAKFVIFGDMQAAVADAWQKIWQLPLERTYTGDFEEYVSTEENGEAEIHIYIAVK